MRGGLRESQWQIRNSLCLAHNQAKAARISRSNDLTISAI
ncbi:hypothetical protein PSP6_50081 [Paraburkholderia tropica]|nr:hypothetical protein PSP6_50081 [Paraburkholderia tropica]